MADYLTTKDSTIFKDYMAEAAECQIKLYERYEAGQKVSWSYLDEDTFVRLWNALAAGDWPLAKRLMDHIYQHNSDLKKAGHFNRGFNHMLQAVMLDVPLEENIFQTTYEIFAKRHKSYAVYILAFEAIYHQEVAKFEAAFEVVMKGHKVLCRRGAEFGDSEDEIIAIWPLAVLNLARLKGMNVQVETPFIPPELIAVQ